MISKSLIKNLPLIGLLSGIVFIGFAGIFTRLAECAPTMSAFWRSAFVLPIFLFMLVQPSNLKELRHTSFFNLMMLLLIGAIFGIDIAIWNASLNYTVIANAAFLSTTTPLFISIITCCLGWQNVNIKICSALLITLWGAGLMTFGSQTPELNWFGDGLAMFSAVLFAVYIMMIARFRHKINLWVILLFCDLGACLALGFTSFTLGESLMIPDRTTLFWLLALSMISQLLGQGLVTTALKYFSPTFSALALTLTPVVCVIGAWFIFEESLSFVQLIGMISIAGGIYFCKQESTTIHPYTNGMIKLRSETMDKI